MPRRPRNMRCVGSPQSGIGLVELLVGMALGLIFLAGLVNLYLSAARTRDSFEALVRIHEQARLALDILGRDVRQAGYRHALTRGDDPPRDRFDVAVLGCSGGGFLSDILGAGQLPQTPVCSPGGGAVREALYLRYESGEADVFLDVHLSDPGRGRGANCLGQWPPVMGEDRSGVLHWVSGESDVAGVLASLGNRAGSNESGEVSAAPRVVTSLIQNIYTLEFRSGSPAGAASGTGRLMCRAVGRDGRTLSAQPLVSGVRELQFGYRLIGDAPDAAPRRASEVDATAWSTVSSVHVCLVIEDELAMIPVTSEPRPSCAGHASSAIPPAAGRDAPATRRALARRFDAVFALRNRG